MLSKQNVSKDFNLVQKKFSCSLVGYLRLFTYPRYYTLGFFILIVQGSKASDCISSASQLQIIITKSDMVLKQVNNISHLRTHKSNISSCLELIILPPHLSIFFLYWINRLTLYTNKRTICWNGSWTNTWNCLFLIIFILVSAGDIKTLIFLRHLNPLVCCWYLFKKRLICTYPSSVMKRHTK